MTLTSKSAAVLLLDFSASMNRSHPGDSTEDDGAASRDRSAFEMAKEYVKAKVIQRIMRDLRTIPVAVLAFGHPKTKNIMTTRAKEAARENEEAFDRQKDGYRGIYELLPLTFNPDQSSLERIDQAVAGQGQDGDAHTALVAAIETLEAQGSIMKYPTKEIFILTDGETETDWDEWKSTVRKLTGQGISLKVVGIDFDDEYMGYVEENKSETKRENERMYSKVVKKLNDVEGIPTSLVANAVSALAAISTPNPKRTNSRPDKMSLTLGDPEEHPDRSLVMYIDVKKAVVPAPIPSMKKMSLAGFDRNQQSLEESQRGNGQRTSLGGTKRGHDEIEIKEEESADRFNKLQRGTSTMGKIGQTFEKTLRTAGLQESTDIDADLASHNVTTERRQFYRPSFDPKKFSSTVKVKHNPIRGGYADEEETAREEDEGEEERKEVPDDAELVPAYFYGGDLVKMDFGEMFGKLEGLKTGMEVISFMKMSDVRYDWRMGDVFYVYASLGQTASGKLFSAFVNAMEERKSCAVVRFIKKGFNSSKLGGTHVMPDPQVGILFPATDQEARSEFCHYIRLPFGEDIRSPGFPSLSNLFNRKGQRIETHPHLSTKGQDQAMEEFVDAMNLENAAEIDEDGATIPWFRIDESYSPAIHNIQNTLMFRLTAPDGDLPSVPTSLTRYLDPPPQLVKSASQATEAVKEAFKVLAVPPKPRKATKANENYVQPEDERAASAYAALFGSSGAPAAEQAIASKAPRVSQVKVNATSIEVKGSQNSQSQSQSQPLPRAQAGPVPVIELDEDDEMEEPVTEDEDEEDAPKPSTTFSNSAGRGEKAKIAEVVEAARRLIETSFSNQNFSKATVELHAARNSAIKLNNPTAYNSAIRTFAEKIVDHKHRDYLRQIESENLGLLVGDGTTEADAEDFLEALY
ncbi:hypothetical protein JCM16303_000149 [Sporobolomyces ruberrimus]